MLSKKAKYAIKALVYLAKKKDREPVRISVISREEKIPRKFLEAILLDLRNNSVVSSKMGTAGGYFLLKDPKEIMLTQIIRLMDGPIAMVSCASLNFYRKCDDCTDEYSCGIRDVFKDLRIATLHILSNNSIADIIKREKKLSGKARKLGPATGKKKRS